MFGGPLVQQVFRHRSTLFIGKNVVKNNQFGKLLAAVALANSPILRNCVGCRCFGHFNANHDWLGIAWNSLPRNQLRTVPHALYFRRPVRPIATFVAAMEVVYRIIAFRIVAKPKCIFGLGDFHRHEYGVDVRNLRKRKILAALQHPEIHGRVALRRVVGRQGHASVLNGGVGAYAGGPARDFAVSVHGQRVRGRCVEPERRVVFNELLRSRVLLQRLHLYIVPDGDVQRIDTAAIGEKDLRGSRGRVGYLGAEVRAGQAVDLQSVPVEVEGRAGVQHHVAERAPVAVRRELHRLRAGAELEVLR